MGKNIYTKYSDYNSDHIFTSGQENTHHDDLPPINILNLLDYTWAQRHPKLCSGKGFNLGGMKINGGMHQWYLEIDELHQTYQKFKYRN